MSEIIISGWSLVRVHQIRDDLFWFIFRIRDSVKKARSPLAFLTSLVIVSAGAISHRTWPDISNVIPMLTVTSFEQAKTLMDNYENVVPSKSEKNAVDSEIIDAPNKRAPDYLRHNQIVRSIRFWGKQLFQSVHFIRLFANHQ
jgi:hypothetical protein